MTITMKPKDWIRIEDKKPRYGKRVLVCQTIGEEQFVGMATLVKNDFGDYLKWYDDEGFDLERVTHWMPIVLPRKIRSYANMDK